jgi:penicillin-binding protein 1A
LNARNTLIPLALFALAFVGSLFVLRSAAPPWAAGPAMGTAAAASLRVAAAVPSGAAPDARADIAVVSAGASAAAAGGANGAALSRAVGSSAGAAGTSPAASNAAPVAEVAAAPAELPLPIDGPLPSVTESYALLKNSGTPEERARAILVISEAARSGVDIARARHALRWAAGDTDPDVAARAQEAYEQLIERDER